MGTVTGDGMRNLAAHSHILADDGRSLYGSADVDQCCHIADHTAHIERQLSAGNHAPCDLEDDGFFVPGGIIAVHQVQRDIVSAAERLFQCMYSVVIMRLGGDDTACCDCGFHGQRHAVHDALCLALHQQLIHAQQRLTFSAIGDYILSLTVELDVSGKTRAARTDDTGSADGFNNVHNQRILS